MAEKEYIERKAAQKVLADDYAYNAAKLLDTVPTAEVQEVRHGKWELIDECANEGVYCSNCHKKVYKAKYANQRVESNYCPNCGAKMDKE